MFDLTHAEIVAYIGAAAWLPHIIQLIYKLAVRPKLSVHAAETVEIGYTVYGPIVNLPSAISASRGDALIVKIQLVMTHEKGERRELTWSRLNETQHEIRNRATGEFTEVTKDQRAIALQVTTSNLSEKIIGFQDLEFQGKARNVVKLASDAFFDLSKGPQEPHTLVQPEGARNGDERLRRFLQSSEWSQYLEFFSNGMYWKEGQYECLIELFVVNQKSPQSQRFKLSISKKEFDALRGNTHQIVPDFLSSVGYNEKPRWSWIYPRIQKM